MKYKIISLCAATLLVGSRSEVVYTAPQIRVVYTIPAQEIVYTASCIYTERLDPWIEVPALVTAYSPHDPGDASHWSTKDTVTSIGVDWRSHPYGVAADPRILPYGTPVKIPDYLPISYPDKAWAIDDTGGQMRQSWNKGIIHIDVRFRSSQWAARWGVRQVLVRVDTSSLTEAQIDRLHRYKEQHHAWFH